MRAKRQGIMLAEAATEKNMLSLGDSCFSQPKLNGERASVTWFHGEPILLSSYGNEFKFIQHIKEAIKDSFGNSQLPLDGELYVHGWSRERIHSAASRKVNENLDTRALQFHVFDFKGNPDQSQWQRIHTLAQNSNNFDWPLFCVPYKVISTDPKEWMLQVYNYTQEGYEGAIFRNPLYYYEEKRSKGLLKFKPSETDEYEILGTVEAVSKEGIPKATIGAFMVQGDDGTQFKVGAGKLSHSERIKLWREREGLIGKNLLVKHEMLKTKNGIPLCCVAVEVIE